MSVQVFDSKQVVKLLGISLRTLYRYTRDGLISYSQVERKLFFTEENILEFLQQHKKETFLHQLKSKKWKI